MALQHLPSGITLGVDLCVQSKPTPTKTYMQHQKNVPTQLFFGPWPQGQPRSVRLGPLSVFILWRRRTLTLGLRSTGAEAVRSDWV